MRRCWPNKEQIGSSKKMSKVTLQHLQKVPYLTLIDIDSFRDGGTTEFTFRHFFINDGEHFTIMQDFRIGTKTPFSIWVGYPGKEDSFEIVDEDVIKKIIDGVEERSNRLQHCVKQLKKFKPKPLNFGVQEK